MSKKVTIGSAEYTLAQQGTEKGWGETESDLIEALVDSVNAFNGPGDILPTAQGISNAVGITGNLNALTGMSGALQLEDGTGAANTTYRATVAGEYDYSQAADPERLVKLQVGQFLVYNDSTNIWEKKQTPPSANYVVVPFFQFDGNVVSFFEAEYTIIRKYISGGNQTVQSEVGKIFGENKPLNNLNPAGSEWSISQQLFGDSESNVYFQINANGQIQYTSDNMDLSTYDSANSKITFKVKAIIK